MTERSLLRRILGIATILATIALLTAPAGAQEDPPEPEPEPAGPVFDLADISADWPAGTVYAATDDTISFDITFNGDAPENLGLVVVGYANADGPPFAFTNVPAVAADVAAGVLSVTTQAPPIGDWSLVYLAAGDSTFQNKTDFHADQRRVVTADGVWQGQDSHTLDFSRISFSTTRDRSPYELAAINPSWATDATVTTPGSISLGLDFFDGGPTDVREIGIRFGAPDGAIDPIVNTIRVSAEDIVNGSVEIDIPVPAATGSWDVEAIWVSDLNWYARTIYNGGGYFQSRDVNRVELIGEPHRLDLGRLSFNTIDPMCNGMMATVILAAGDMPTEGADIILGTPGNDVINGLGGNDVICAGDGNDLISGGTGDDTIFGGNGDDSMDGDDGHDTLHGEDGNDRMWGGKGQDEMNGHDGRDLLFGEQHGDRIIAGHGHDRIRGGGGPDYIDGGHGTELIRGNSGDDTIFGGASDDTIWAGPGIDTVDGGTRTDFCRSAEISTRCER